MPDHAYPSGPEAVAGILRAAGCPVSAEQTALLAAHASLLLEWNGKLNLISRKDADHLWRNHILHSLAVLVLERLPDKGTIMDLGTGGGLPGLPLAIMLPRARFVLCDSIAKKIRAVQSMAESLGLRNVECLTSRVEDLHRDTYARGFDAVLARAVTRLPDLVSWASPLLRPAESSRLIVWKGGDVGEEIREARDIAGVREIAVTSFERVGVPYYVEQEKMILTVSFDLSGPTGVGAGAGAGRMP
jgi:16S rRNA (guanine527-N7)-methyltransferase